MENVTDFYHEALAVARKDDHDSGTVYDLLLHAVEQGDTRAKYAIATWYLAGNACVPKDERRGVEILKELVNADIAEALFDLAYAYDLGRYVRKNARRAFSLYMRAALLGDQESCVQIAEFYREGRLVPHDMGLSRAWKRRSEERQEDISPPYRVWISR
jgi:uncharacterized protein